MTMSGKKIRVQEPITLEFNVSRNNLASANTAQFTLYNLGPATRDLIYKDQFDTSAFLPVQLYAGYNDGFNSMLPMIFNGYIKAAYSYREGADYKTTIEAYDSYIAPTSQVSASRPAGSPLKELINVAMSGMSNIKNNVIGNGFDDQIKRGTAMVGDPMDIMNQITNDKTYIDNQTVYVLGEKDVVPSDIRKLSYENGLLNTPRKSQNLIEVTCLFEPRLKPSQFLELVSVTYPKFNGVYKVTGITHSGVISGAICGEAVTNLQMIFLKNWTVVYDTATQTYIAGDANG